MVHSIDFPRSELPASFQYCGPFRRAAQEQFDLPEGDGRPLVYCTLGTLQGSRTALFRKVAEACAALNLRLLISHGRAGKMDHDLPGDPLIYDWVPQQAVLRHADLVICHGGMNTVLDSLAAGVPLATVPLAFEQAATAARLEFAGVGRTVLSRSPTAQIGDAIAQVRSAPTYLQKALAVQREICNAGGAARAADLIEQSIGAVARRAAATTAPTGQDGARGDSRNGNS
jgi:zeaxanthin glucosyltransferase